MCLFEHFFAEKDKLPVVKLREKQKTMDAIYRLQLGSKNIVVVALFFFLRKNYWTR